MKDNKPRIYHMKDRLNFGKYKDITIEDVIKFDASYLLWAMCEIDWFCMSDADRERIEKCYLQQDTDRHVRSLKNKGHHYTEDQYEDYMEVYGSDPHMWGD
jgi:hypothetical protein